MGGEGLQEWMRCVGDETDCTLEAGKGIRRSGLSNLLPSMQRSWIEGVQLGFGELGELGEVED
ncbi:hypothetical protein QUA71_21250 [Microcoleus sp. MON1_C5]|uniref:hypothetical protein n=1 Tax=Microcoleus sp. MON1_C5 TaxID=2818828 RepID=UPI002FD6073C